MIILNDIHKWVLLDPSEGIVFANPRPRPITLDFNIDGMASVHVLIDGEKETRFLALLHGRETVKFVAPGSFKLILKESEGDAYVLASDGSKVHREALEEEVFTTLHTPRVVDPAVQRMMDNINKNMARRMEAQRLQFEREMANERERADNLAAAVSKVSADSPDRVAPPPTGSDAGGDDSSKAASPAE